MKKNNWKYLSACKTGIIATIIGLLAVNIDLGAYFAAWIYIILFSLIFFARRLINIGIFVGVNSLVFGAAVRQLLPWGLLALIAFGISFTSLMKIDKKPSQQAEG